MNLLEDKVVVVTGVSSGLGRSVAEVFAERGAKVVGVARRADRGEALVQAVAERGGQLRFVQADVAVVDDCRRAVDEAMAAYGRIDALVNNAGTLGRRPILPATEVTEQDWDEVVDVNLKGVFFMCKFALAHMVEQRRGTILNISSTNAVNAIANMSAYNASKAGVIQLSRTLAVENVMHRVRVNAVVLGSVRTEMFGEVTREMGRSVAGAEWEPTSTVDYGMRPERVARALSLLCSDDASVITGAVIAVDEGTSAGLLASTFTYMVSAEQLKF
jgi:NAD(P)-dependent dehydrogenase (short-subunit alcohol dehydrogenase family)